MGVGGAGGLNPTDKQQIALCFLRNAGPDSPREAFGSLWVGVGVGGGGQEV